MADRSAIEWCDSTFNPWTGCTKISPACDHCYAESLSKRAPKSIAQWGAGQPRRRTSAANWRTPLRWNTQPFVECTTHNWRGEARKLCFDRGCPARRPGDTCAIVATRRRVFCASLADVFDNEVDPQWRADLLDLIEATPNLDWLLLTKRIGNVVPLLTGLRDSEPSDYRWGRLNAWLKHGLPPENVWLGATICDQAEADRDVPKLLQVPARVRFLSIEPMLGPVDLQRIPVGARLEAQGLPRHFNALHPGMIDRIDWIIAGGESGAHARPSHPDWFRALRDQCAAAGVPFLFKQWGEWWEADSDARDPDTGGHVAVDPDSLDGEELWDPRTGSLVTMDGRRFTPETLPADAPARLMVRIGKKAAGRLLDGREHNGFPA